MQTLNINTRKMIALFIAIDYNYIDNCLTVKNKAEQSLQTRVYKRDILNLLN